MYLLVPRTCLMRQAIQSTAAFEKANVSSVLIKTLNTSNKDDKWLLLTTLRAPNNGLQPDLMSERLASTNSHKQLTIFYTCIKKKNDNINNTY